MHCSWCVRRSCLRNCIMYFTLCLFTCAQSLLIRSWQISASAPLFWPIVPHIWHCHVKRPRRKLICVFGTVQRSNTYTLAAREDQTLSCTVQTCVSCEEKSCLYEREWKNGLFDSICFKPWSVNLSSIETWLEDSLSGLTVSNDAAKFKIWRRTQTTAAKVEPEATGPTGTVYSECLYNKSWLL